MRPANTYISTLAIMIFSVMVALVIAEFGLRVFGYEPHLPYRTSLGYQKILDPAPGIPHLYRAFGSYSQHWPSNPRGYFDKVSNGVFYEVNNFGFRDDDFSVSRGEKIRIAFFGDSFCWGNGVKINDHYASIIEKRLNQLQPAGLGYEVYNFCLGSYNTEQEAALYDLVGSKFRPDIVVVWYFLNDVDTERGIGTMTYMGGDDLLTEWRSHSRVLDLVIYPFDRYIGAKKLVQHYLSNHHEGSVGYASVQRGLQRFKRVSESLNVSNYLVIFPILFELNEDKYPFAPAHKMVRNIAKKNGFRVLDLFPVFEGEIDRDLWVHPIDQHPNEKAHGLAAGRVSEFLAENIRYESDRLVESVAHKRRTTGIQIPNQKIVRDWFTEYHHIWSPQSK